MENASKFLLMAGGILVGMLTISIFYFMFSQISKFKSITETDYTQEELQAFNQGFESYNKKLMYGSDVISVINKAVDNNMKNQVFYKKNGDYVSEIDNEYYVDINVNLKKPLYVRIENYKRMPNGTYEKDGRDTEKTIFKPGTTSGINSFKVSKDYKDIIKYILIDGGSIETDEGIINQSNTSVMEYNSDKSRYKVTYYPAAEFKRMTFQCKGVTYNEFGRVNSMTFTQYK